MSELSNRQSLILERIVREYIKLAQPISSEFLEKKYQFGLCSASIRNEMQKLTERGFLFQPHPSAGRIPTDKGYRFFVDNLLEKELDSFQMEDEFSEIASSLFKNEIKDEIQFIQLLTKKIAQISRALALSYLEKEKVFLKEGWEEILKEPEFGEKNFVLSFTEFLENFEDTIRDFEINSGIKIYIGKENPFGKTRDFSIILTKCCLPENEKGIISLLGPKRMAYDRNISLMDSLTKLLTNF